MLGVTAKIAILLFFGGTFVKFREKKKRICNLTFYNFEISQMFLTYIFSFYGITSAYLNKNDNIHKNVVQQIR